MRFRNRIPVKYFITSGIGESDITIHAGSFDQALKDAGIHNVNIITYSSIMPKEAVRIEKKELKFGSVAETIMAVANGEKGQRVTAGLIIAWVYDKNGNKIGGLVAEYHGNDEEEKAKEILKASINEMFKSRFSDDYKLKDVEIYTKSFIPKKKYGTAIVAIVFTSYEFPEA
ncbi:MAG: pyruvoyl-dependent arginine decarboxylase [Candidatus Aenigmatarchaeota archaeon]|jgi:arginine decarboxylase